MIKLRILRWKIILCYVDGPREVTRVFTRERGRLKGQSQRERERDLKMLHAGFEDGEWIREPRNGGGPQRSWKTWGNRLSPSLMKEDSPANILILGKTYSGLLSSRIVR